jgi:hypothetical protein
MHIRMHSPARTTCLLLASIVAGAGGCGGPGSGSPNPPTDTANVCHAEPVVIDRGDGVLVLPPRIENQIATPLFVDGASSSDDALVAQRGGVVLALHPEAARVVSVTLDSIIDPRCCCGPVPGRLVLTDVVAGPATSVDLAIEDDATVQLTLHEPGIQHFEFQAVLLQDDDATDGCGAPLPATLPVTIPFQVEVVAPRYTFEPLSSCSDRALLQEGSALPFVVAAHDQTGARVYPSNLLHPTVTVTGEGLVFKRRDAPDPAVSEFAWFFGNTVADVVVTGTGPISLQAAGGPAFAARVVPTAAIDDAEIVFALPAVAGGGVRLEDGETYRGFGRTGDRVVAHVLSVSSGGVRLCSAPQAKDFQLASRTPSTCPVEGHVCAGEIDNNAGVLLPDTARVIADGRCGVALTAPALDGGRGLVRIIGVTLLGADSLIEVGR